MNLEKLKNQINQDPWRLKFHIMPETGWLNDPMVLSNLMVFTIFIISMYLKIH